MSCGSLGTTEEITSRYQSGEEEETGPLCGCRNLLNIVQAFRQIPSYSLSYSFLMAKLPLLTAPSTGIPTFLRRNHDR
ncbi:hypothetical protein GHT06_017743 [Daphnia sinensis]|uniref:Uncharacterized protein n=1 Tax=Daphnia sinensis TaxID=1820382 RepID=A0AAD5LCP1_9CRUS|nr:hypothetical protein GHT06_017743 [Daphnia sinensis]